MRPPNLFPLLIGIAMCIASAAAADEPRACQTTEGNNLPLPDDQSVLVHTVDLVASNDIRQSYAVKTYSDTGQSGESRSEQCFRYEAVNVDRKLIHNFNWALAGFWIDPFEPNQRVSTRRKQDVLEQPVDTASRLNAFENHEGITRAWADRTTGDTYASADGSLGAKIAVLSPASINTELPAFLASNNLVDRPIATYTFSPIDNSTFKLRSAFIGADIHL